MEFNEDTYQRYLSVRLKIQDGKLTKRNLLTASALALECGFFDEARDHLAALRDICTDMVLLTEINRLEDLVVQKHLDVIEDRNG